MRMSYTSCDMRIQRIPGLLTATRLVVNLHAAMQRCAHVSWMDASRATIDSEGPHKLCGAKYLANPSGHRRSNHWAQLDSALWGTRAAGSTFTLVDTDSLLAILLGGCELSKGNHILRQTAPRVHAAMLPSHGSSHFQDVQWQLVAWESVCYRICLPLCGAL
jgi:hypothetical protein